MTTLELVTLTKQVAGAQGLDPVLLCAMAESESSWNAYAVRCESESGFARRYGAAYAKLVHDSATKADDRWLGFEDLFYSSYGLLQTMYPCVIEAFPEAADALVYPTKLCDPQVGLLYGCKLFSLKLRQARGRVPQALLYWNGGADPQYPARVLSRQERYR